MEQTNKNNMAQEEAVGTSTNTNNNSNNNQETKPTTPTNCPPLSQNQREDTAAADNQDQQLLQALQQQQIQQQHMIALQAMQQQQQQIPFITTMPPQTHLLQPAMDPLLQGLVIPNLPPTMDPSFATAVAAAASVNNTNNDKSTESIMATEIPAQAVVLNQQQQQQQQAALYQNQMMNPLVLQAMLGQGGMVNTNQQQMGQQMPTNNEVNNGDETANSNNDISNNMAGINNPMLALTVLANGGQVTPAQIMNGIPVNNYHAAQRTIAQQPYIPMSTTNINAFNNQQLQQMNNSIQQMHTWSKRRQPYQRKKKNKDKDKPKRPLSAYNYFFQEERGRILNKKNADKEKEEGKEEKNDEDDDKKIEVENSAESTKKDEDKNEDNTAVDSEGNSKKESTKRTKTRQKTGIGFESLARQIGARWKELNDEEVAKYKDLAAADTIRYKMEMEVYKEKVKHAVDGETKVNEMNPFFLRPDVKEAYTYIRPEVYTNLQPILHGQEPMNKRPRKTIAGDSIVMDI